MRLDKEAKIAGLPALEVRRLLRRHFDGGWLISAAARTLGVDETEAERVLRELEEQGLISIRTSASGSELVWELELPGRSFAKASAANPIRRETAKKHLDAFLDRVRAANASDDYLHWVKRVVLFGSFLDPGTDPVGDVDIAIELEFKDHERHMELRKKYAANAIAQGRRFSTYLDRMFAAEHDLKKFLKSRSRVIQLTETGDPILERAESKTIYEFKSDS